MRLGASRLFNTRKLSLSLALAGSLTFLAVLFISKASAVLSFRLNRVVKIPFVIPQRLVGDAPNATKESHSDAGGRPLHVAVCITGQKERLEIESKLKHLADVKGANIDLLLVLSNASAKSVNPLKSGEKANHSSIEAGLQKLRAKAHGFRYLTMEQPKSPMLSPEYTSHLNFQHQKQDKKVFRATVHVNQFYSISKCYSEMLIQEALNGRKYDLVLRLRDDLLFLNDFDPLAVYKYLHKRNKDVVQQKCDAWGGVNDKVAAITRESAEKYLTGFFDYYYLFRERLNWEKIHNPETFTREVMRSSNLRLIRTFEPLLPGVPSSKADHKTCFKVRPDGILCYQMIFKESAQRLADELCHNQGRK